MQRYGRYPQLGWTNGFMRWTNKIFVVHIIYPPTDFQIVTEQILPLAEKKIQKYIADKRKKTYFCKKYTA